MLSAALPELRVRWRAPSARLREALQQKPVQVTQPAVTSSCPRIFSVLSAILYLGNVTYRKRATGRDEGLEVGPPEVLDTLSQLLKVPPVPTLSCPCVLAAHRAACPPPPAISEMSRLTAVRVGHIHCDCSSRTSEATALQGLLYSRMRIATHTKLNVKNRNHSLLG